MEQTALLAFGMWLLPLIDIHISWWLLGLIMLANLSFSIFTYVMGLRALRKLPFGEGAGIIGCNGIVITQLSPTGYVKVHNELWKASSNKTLMPGEEVIITAIDGLTITVISKPTKNMLNSKIRE